LRQPKAGVRPVIRLAGLKRFQAKWEPVRIAIKFTQIA
jgi:hypothetical protein